MMNLAKKWSRLILDKAEQISALKQKGPRQVSCWEVGVSFATKSKIKKLNHEYLGKNKTTDIISFPSPDPFWASGYLGDLVICGDVLKKQAREHGHSEQRELVVLLVHGVLHLLGWDHERSKKESVTMSLWEKKLIESVLSESRLSKKTPKGLLQRSL